MINKRIERRNKITMLIKRERMNRNKWNNKIKPCTRTNCRHAQHTLDLNYVLKNIL
jgi:hypothetical protein